MVVAIMGAAVAVLAAVVAFRGGGTASVAGTASRVPASPSARPVRERVLIRRTRMVPLAIQLQRLRKGLAHFLPEPA